MASESGASNQGRNRTMDTTVKSLAGNSHAREIYEQIPKAFLNCNKDGFYAVDLSYKYIYWSEGMKQITGMTASEVLGKNAFDVFPFLRDIGQQHVLDSVFAGEEVNTPNRPFKIPESGRDGYFSASYSPFRVANDEIVGALAIVKDVTAEKRASDLQSETEDRFRKMADSSPVMLWMAGKDALCTFFNSSWLEFSGKTMQEELGVGWAEGVHPVDFQRCMDTYLECFRERRSFEMEYRLLRHDGQYRWILDRGVPRYSPEGSFAGYIGSCIDITERKILEEELRKTIHLREEFLSIASHELKTPLTSLGLQVQIFHHLLKSAPSVPDLNQQMEPMMEIAERQLRHMAQLVETLLDISRIESGKFRLDRAEMNFSQSVRETLDRMRALARQAGCEIKVDAPESLVGTWDRARVEQVLSNLLSNAIKYAPGKPIQVRLIQEPELVVLEVEDQGPGVDSSISQSIFEKFHRGSHDKNPGGLGLGLFIVRQIVHAHSGKVSVHPGSLKGAVFRVELPLHPNE